MEAVRKIFLKWGDDCRWILRSVSLNYAPTGRPLNGCRSGRSHVTSHVKSREYSTVTRDHHIYFGGNQQLGQFKVSLEARVAQKILHVPYHMIVLHEVGRYLAWLLINGP